MRFDAHRLPEGYDKSNLERLRRTQPRAGDLPRRGLVIAGQPLSDEMIRRIEERLAAGTPCVLRTYCATVDASLCHCFLDALADLIGGKYD